MTRSVSNKMRKADFLLLFSSRLYIHLLIFVLLTKLMLLVNGTSLYGICYNGMNTVGCTYYTLSTNILHVIKLTSKFE